MTDDADKPADKPGEAPATVEAATPPPPTRRSQPIPIPPVLPTPTEAALEAARIVSEMVDIDSESGAVIAAAAAAGAAIEAAVAAQKMAAAAEAAVRAESSPGLPGEVPVLAELHATSGGSASSVKLSRERILQALADEETAQATGEPVPRRARSEPSIVRPRTDPGASGVRLRTDPGASGVRPRTEPSAEDAEELDPVAIAAAAIARLRSRARDDFGQLRVHYQRLDLLVVLCAVGLIVLAGWFHASLVTPPNQTFPEHGQPDHGLTFEHSAAWFAPEAMPMPAPRIVHEVVGGAVSPKHDTLYHVELTSTRDPQAKIEVLVDKKPAWSNIVTGLELDRRTRWGELYNFDDSSVRAVAGHDWLRTAYRYAHVPDKGDVPRIDRAVEYATVDREQIYVVTLFGTPEELELTEDVVAPSLRVQSQTGLPLVPQTGRLSERTYPAPVGLAFESTVMVVVADLVDGRLVARGGGSGVIVGGDGSILTNYHVIHDHAAVQGGDPDVRLHDVFVIARYKSPDQAPQLAVRGATEPRQAPARARSRAAQVRHRSRRPRVEPRERWDLGDAGRDPLVGHQDGPAAVGARLSRRRRWRPDVVGGRRRRLDGTGTAHRGATSSRPMRRSHTATRAARWSTIRASWSGSRPRSAPRSPRITT